MRTSLDVSLPALECQQVAPDASKYTGPHRTANEVWGHVRVIDHRGRDQEMPHEPHLLTESPARLDVARIGPPIGLSASAGVA